MKGAIFAGAFYIQKFHATQSNSDKICWIFWEYQQNLPIFSNKKEILPTGANIAKYGFGHPGLSHTFSKMHCSKSPWSNSYPQASSETQILHTSCHVAMHVATTTPCVFAHSTNFGFSAICHPTWTLSRFLSITTWVTTKPLQTPWYSWLQSHSITISDHNLWMSHCLHDPLHPIEVSHILSSQQDLIHQQETQQGHGDYEQEEQSNFSSNYLYSNPHATGQR